MKYLLSENAIPNRYASVHFILMHGILAYDSTFPFYLTKLSKLQNKAIRIVTGKNWNRKSAPLKTKYIAIGFSFKLRNS